MPKSKNSYSKSSDKASSKFMGAMLTGIASRSAETSKVHRLFRDGHASQEEFLSAVNKDSEKLLSAQNDFAFVSGGQLNWLDILRPIAKSISGFSRRASLGEDSVGPVTRWFRTNTFYRKPLIDSKIEAKGTELNNSLPTLNNKSVVFLLAPYSFSRLVENSFYEDDSALALDYAKAISKCLPNLEKVGYSCALLLEPYIGFELSKKSFKEPDWYEKPISEIKSSGLTIGINYPLAQARSIVPIADRTDADFIGIDAIVSSDFKIETEKDILLGIADGARAGVESSESAKRTVQVFISKASFPGRYYISPNDRLYDVPFEIALNKINMLSKFRGV